MLYTNLSDSSLSLVSLCKFAGTGTVYEQLLVGNVAEDTDSRYPIVKIKLDKDFRGDEKGKLRVGLL